jgi:hypothetical protein
LGEEIGETIWGFWFQDLISRWKFCLVMEEEKQQGMEPPALALPPAAAVDRRALPQQPQQPLPVKSIMVGGLGAACYAGAEVMASGLHAYVSKLFLLRIQILMSCLFVSWCLEHSSVVDKEIVAFRG